MLEENPIIQGNGGRMLTNRRGFSLVELLVVLVVFGVITTVILDLYTNVQKSTLSSEEVVEVQQGMRIALDRVARDIQMSGVMVTEEMPIIEARNNRITMETSSAFNTFARIPAAATFPLTDSAMTFTVGEGMADHFRVGIYVRVVNPVDGCQATAADCGDRDGTAQLFQISSVGATSLRLERDPADTPAEVLIPAGSLIVRVPSPTEDNTYPNVVTYELEDDPDSNDPAMMVLSRTWRAGLTLSARTIATNISALRFEYLLDDGTVAPVSPATELVPLEREKIIAVRILLTGLTAEAKTGTSKVRELQTTVKLRNI